MKSGFICTILAMLALFVMSAPAQAGRGVAVYSSGDTITQVVDLPNKAPFAGSDLGFKHYQFKLFWMPIWGSSEGSYVVYKDAPNGGWRYKSVSTAQATAIASAVKAELSPPGMFARMWGLLVLLAFVGGAIAWNKMFGEDAQLSAAHA